MQLVVEFTKMNGAGNDFIVIDNRFYRFSDEELSGFAQRLCPRRTGIGADGLLAFNPPNEAECDFRMRYVNADGAFGTMCGNGARCLALFARRAGMDAPSLRFETDAGVFRAESPAPGLARVYQHALSDYARQDALASLANMDIADAHYIWTGTEHLVCFVDCVADVPATQWGALLRWDEALAPAGANIDFVEVASADRLLARTYEKGVEAETLACGTGAIASAVVARMLGRAESDRICVDMPGGRLAVGFPPEDSDMRDIYLEGPAEATFRGTFEA